jgi:AcrR family transcriptional regulator
MAVGTIGRDQLVAAAETLFAERGVDAVSLREINAASGARNSSAVQYHFGGRAGLIRAVLEKHTGAVEIRRHALLDQFEARGEGDLRTLVGALVRPLADELQTEGGSGYLQVLADVMNRPSPPINPAGYDNEEYSLIRWRSLVKPFLDPEAVRHHRRFLAMRFTATELARRARSKDRVDHRLFVSDLIDLVTGLLDAPVSAETRRTGPATVSSRSSRS